MGKTNSKNVPVVPASFEDAEQMITIAKEVFHLFIPSPKLKETFKNLFLKATAVMKYGVEQVQTEFSASYCLELTISLTVFSLMEKNYKLFSLDVQCLKDAEKTKCRRKKLYEREINPVLVDIDEQFEKERPSAAVQLKDILHVMLEETQQVSSEIDDDITNVNKEIESQETKNNACIGGTGFSAAGFLMAPIPIVQWVAVGLGGASYLGYKCGTDNKKKLKDDLERLERGKKYAMDFEDELLNYIKRLEAELESESKESRKGRRGKRSPSLNFSGCRKSKST